MKRIFAPAVLAVLLILSSAWSQKKSATQNASPLSEVSFKGIHARSIGPAIMSGRVSDIAIDPKDPSTFYVGLGTGGVMKTSDDGGSFSAIFEKEAVASVGAIAIAPSNSKYVWVGSGEANDRNSSSWGNGVYLSTDGGGKWNNVGLKESRSIARIAVDPVDSTTAYVAAMGNLWAPGGERGLYKTTDAGKTWKLVLSAVKPYDKSVGCGDVVIDPNNSRVLYAALYARRRTPWSFQAGPDVTDGKDLGGIFKSEDGGATWKKLQHGLPVQTGRIGLTIYPPNPQILYAVVQSDSGGTSNIDNVHSKSGGTFRTADGGSSWTRVSPLDPRPFYFSQIRVDPKDSSHIYVLGFALHVSLDGGRTFREDYFEKVHPDCHAFAIDPNNPKRVIIGTDGGAYISYGAGKGWRHLNSFAAGEFYRVTLDMSTPYRVAGGLQDNQNWVGPSTTNSKDGITNADWTDLGGGDGFYCVFDPNDPNTIYFESQEGYISRINLKNGQEKELRPEPAEGAPSYRFNWNSPFFGSVHEQGVMYLAGNHVFRLWDRGERWKMISPDLSAANPQKIFTSGSGAENYGVVYTLAESPVKKGMLWAGTDDGKLWLTEDGGAGWHDLTKGLPKDITGLWISRVEPSHFDEKVAYLAVDAHTLGNLTPFLFRTSDAGKTWKSISTDLPDGGPVKVVREDPANPNLLFVGTEFGLYMSLDRGGRWIKFGELPTVAVDDIQIHPRDRDLVVATHGRSLFIVDDIRPLEGLVDSVQQKEAWLFPPRDSFGVYLLNGSVDWTGTTGFHGANAPAGAIFNYYLKSFTGDDVKITVKDSSNHVVANLKGTNTPGLNRVVWDLRMTKDLLNPYGGEGQKFVKPGTYTVNLSYGKISTEQKIQVRIAEGIETR